MIGAKVSPYNYGPRRPRSQAQRRAASNWIRSKHPDALAWVRAQPQLPPGWKIIRGRLTPPADWTWVEGRLIPPVHDQPALDKLTRPLFEELRRKGRMPHEVSIFDKRWTYYAPIGNLRDHRYREMIAWINDPANMAVPGNRFAKFTVKRERHAVHWSFSFQSVALAFFLRFAAPEPHP